MYYFKNKTAIITGSTSGIGKGVAEALHAQGACVMLSGRNTEKGKSICDQLGSNARFLAGDVKRPCYNKRLVEEAIQSFGSLDMVVMSAGQLGIGKIDQLSLEDWHDTIATNLNAVFYLFKYAIPHLRKAKGSVVIMGSVAALHAFPGHPAYTASKGALPALVRQMALDYSPDIRINLVSPAQVVTPLLTDSIRAFENPEDILDETSRKLPMKRLGTVDDIAHTVLHLLSENAGWITGSNFVVDGGFLAT